MSYGELSGNRSAIRVYYKFEGNANDSSLNGLNLTLAGGGGYAKGFLGGQCYKNVRASSQYAWYNGDCGLSTTYTCSYWINQIATPASGQYSYPLSGAIDTTGRVFQWGYFNHVPAGTPKLVWSYTRYGEADYNVILTYTLPIGQWVHLAMTHVPSIMIAYRNGIEVGRVATNTGVGIASTRKFVVGASNNPTPLYPNDAYYDEVIFENRVWSSNEMRNYYNNARGRYAPKVVD